MQRFAFILGLLLLPGWSFAQVVVNHAALDQLAGIVAPPPPAVPPPAIRHAAIRRHIHKPAVQLATAKPLAVAAIVPRAAAPAPPAAHATTPGAPAKPVFNRAPPAAAIIFAPGATDLPAGAAATLKPFCAAPTPITISATAPANPSDPSSAMRLAMMRAFAVRGALVACGTSSANILPRTATSSLTKNPDLTQITEGR